VGPYLFFCQGIHPRAVSALFFSKPSESHSLFYHFFSSPNLDYLPLAEACRILLSRIAFPDDKTGISNVFSAFADAFCEVNNYVMESRGEIAKLAMAAVILSMSRRTAKAHDCLSQADFLRLVQSVRSSVNYKTKLYEAIKRHPITLFFMSMHFNSDPEGKALCLSKTGAVFKMKTRVYCVLHEDAILRTYRDSACKDCSREIPLGNVKTHFTAASGKEPAKLSLASLDGGPFGFGLKKGDRKPSKKTEYVFSCGDEADLRMWMESLSFKRLYLRLMEMTGQ
jgi:hypothetical protein